MLVGKFIRKNGYDEVVDGEEGVGKIWSVRGQVDNTPEGFQEANCRD